MVSPLFTKQSTQHLWKSNPHEILNLVMNEARSHEKCERSTQLLSSYLIVVFFSATRYLDGHMIAEVLT